jgi:CRP/FNR family cyclic AMP-dependent transcriptional regulator
MTQCTYGRYGSMIQNKGTNHRSKIWNPDIYQADLVQILTTIPYFLDLSSQSLARLAGVAELRSLSCGDVLFKEGDRITELFILLEGRISLSAHVPGHGEVCVFNAEPLDIFGWSSLTPVVRQRTATAVAARESMVLVFRAEDMRSLCDQDHEIGYILMRRIANIVASRLLATRLQLYDMIVHLSQPAIETDI